MRWRRSDRAWRTSLRVRLTLWNTAVVLVTTLAMLLVVRIAARSMLYREADGMLRAAVIEIMSALRDNHPDIDEVVDEMRRMTASHQTRGWFMHLLTNDGQTVWKSDNCPDAIADHPPSKLDRRELVADVGPYRYVRQWIRQPGRPRYHLRVGMHTGVLDESVTGLMRLLVPMGVVVTLLTPLIGYLLAVQATRPVGDILRTAGGLRPTRLDDRLPERGTGDELDLLSHTINHLLDQVADHVQRQERFVADAAHELRGPLAAIQSSLEVAVAGAGNTADIHEVLTDTLEASRQLSRVTNDLLLLAEHAGDQRIVRKETVDLALIVRQTVAMFSGVAGEQGIDLSADASAPAPVTGDAAGLRRIVANLLDNALRFTPDGGRVTARVRCDDGHVTLAVEDTGVGLEAHELSRVFERFYKSDPAHSHGDGHRSGGLGLSICKSLVEMLDGSIRIASAPGRGTTVTVVLPATMHATQVSVDAQEPSAAHSVALACTPAPVR